MSDTPISLTVDDLRHFDWKSIIESAEKKTCRIFSELFSSKVKEFVERNDDKSQLICFTLGVFCSFRLNLDTPDNPFASERVFPDGRQSFLPLNIPENILQHFLTIINEISEAEIRSRIADILWVLKISNYQIAEIAIDAYLESAQVLENPVHWVEGANRIERALQLASQLGRKGVYFGKVITYIETLLDRLNGEDSSWFSHKLMNLLIDSRLKNVQKYAQLSEKLASNAENQHDWHRARDYWNLKGQWHDREKDNTHSYEARYKAAETYVKTADDLINLESPVYRNASRELIAAIEAFRRIGAPRELQTQLHIRLLEYQEKDDDFQTFSMEFDISKYAEIGVKSVKGKTLREAILILAGLCHPPSLKTLREQIFDEQGNAPLYFLFAQYQLDAKGRIIAKGSGLGSDTLESNEETIRSEMYRRAIIHQEIHAQGLILPALHQINLEHHIRVEDITEFVIDNPFVPPGHELIFARGLYYGLLCDFTLSTHLLLPQIENSIRYILKQQGVLTTKLSQDGIQEDLDLGTLLYMVETKNFFDEDLLFDLQGLLVSRFGSNLRNNFAHGTMNSFEFMNLRTIYFWRLILGICCYPIIKKMYQDEDGNYQ